ncbi:hypothetical protein [Dietzia maris]|uniref:hypothetical protein n=1 Tax=Dietzia maris TaxID=37915 RepID=UPI001044B8C1
MGNLGRYQEIIELAKSAGGVDAMIEQTKRGAVAEAAPKLVGITLVVGAAIGACATTGVSRVKQAADHRREVQHRAKLAEKNLRLVAKDGANEPEDNDSNEPSALKEPASEGLANLPNDKPPTRTEGYDDADRA